MPSSSNNPKRCLLSCSTAYTTNSAQKKLTNYNVQICLCQEFEHKNMKTIQSLQQNRRRQKENKKNENTVYSCNLQSLESKNYHYLDGQNPICEKNKPSLKILHVDRKTNELCHYHICDVMIKTNYKTVRKMCMENYQTIEKHRPQRLNQSCLQDLYAIAKTMELILMQIKVAPSLHLPQCRHSTVSRPLF